MVMKRNAMRTNLRQSIFKSIGRYIAIAMIIAVGASIFVGLRMTKADMVATGQRYMDKQNMFDLRLVTDYGWSRDQVADIAALEGISGAEGVFYVDLIARQGNVEDEVYRFYTLPRNLNCLVLEAGRMPENPNECLVDGYLNSRDILGKQVVISRENEQSSLETMVETTFTIVGFVRSPLYMDMNRGTTSVGSGSIANYIYIPGEAVDSDYYPEIHVTLPGEYAVYSEEYNDALDAASDRLEAQLDPIAQNRLTQIRNEAEEAYADGYQEYRDGLDEYYEGFHQAYGELRNAYEQLKDGEQELTDNEQLLTDGQQQIEDARLALKDGEKTLEESRKTLASAKAAAYKQLSQSTQDMMLEIQDLKEELALVDEDILSLTTQAIELGAKIIPLETEQAVVETQITQANTMIGILDISIEAAEGALKLAQENGTPEADLEKMRQDIAILKEKRSGYETELVELNQKKADYDAQIAGLETQIQSLEAKKAELESLANRLSASVTGLMESMMELVVTQSVMEQEFAAADAQIEAAEAQIASAYLELEIQEQNIADGWILLEEGREELKKGWEEYAEGREEAEAELADAHRQLKDARAELADARETIDGMTEITLHILDRNTNIGYTSLDSGSDIVQGVSRVFPAFFLLVAALVCITTMTRMVDEERTQIGTLKALGYSNAAIMSKYLLYAGSSAILGCGLGVLAGSVVFPTILWEAYKIMLYIQDGIVLTFDWGLCLLVVGMYTIVELVVTWYCCRRSLKEVPAELIRPKAPEAGKQMLFEKLPFWHQVSFLNKVTIRNIFRYKQRLAMMMVGIGGCTALLLTGFGLRDTIVNIVDFQFEEVTTYDMSVYFSENMTESAQRSFSAQVKADAQELAFYHQTSMDLSFDGTTREIYMISGGEEITSFVDMHRNGQTVPMPGVDEVVLSIGVAEVMGISIGDQVRMMDSELRALDLTVSGFYENYVYNYSIVSPETIEKQWGSPPEWQMAFVKAAPGQDVYKLSAAISGMDKVMNVSVSDDLAGMVRNMMKAMDLVVWVIVFCAALLAAVVLYNLTNININERIREIATIKVLGFNAMETAMYVFKENLTLSVMGAAGGLLLGKLLLDFVISQIKIDFVWFQARALPPSYLWSVGLTLLMAVIVDFVFYFKLDKINMAEALKSVE